LITTLLIRCNNSKKEISSKFNIHEKINDSTIFILTNKYDNDLCLYESDVKLDIESLEDFGKFLTDKYGVYRKYDISDATSIIKLKNVDEESFQTFRNSIYAKDKNHVYVPEMV
jgi:hypothetical protein